MDALPTRSGVPSDLVSDADLGRPGEVLRIPVALRGVHGVRLGGKLVCTAVTREAVRVRGRIGQGAEGEVGGDDRFTALAERLRG